MKNDNLPHGLAGVVRKVWGNFIDEKDYQHYFVDRLVKDNGFVRRENRHIDQAMAMDVGMPKTTISRSGCTTLLFMV